MKLIEPQYIPSAEVSNWFGIQTEAEQLAAFVDEHKTAYAIHHMQVSEKPLNFFVLHEESLKEFIPSLGSRYIINPKVTGIMEQTRMPMYEGCASFPYRKPKKVMRAFIVRVEYDIPDETAPNGLKHQAKQVERIIAQIFQHECDHAQGKNIYFDSPKLTDNK